MRLKADEAVAMLRALDVTSSERAVATSQSRDFALPGSSLGRDPSRPIACDDYLDRAADMLVAWRAAGTWRRYHGAWMRVRPWLERMVKASGLEWHVSTLRDDPRFFTAAARWVYERSPAITAVESAVLAMRMAMRVSGIPVGDDFVTGIIREVTRRERKKSVRKKQGVTFRLVALVNVKWGDVGAPLWRRSVAIMVAIGFVALGRFSDTVLVHTRFIYWCPEGCVLIVMRRKTNQHCVPTLWPVAETGRVDAAGRPVSLVARLRRLVLDLTDARPPVEGWPDPKVGRHGFLLRDISPISGARHPGRIRYALSRRCERPLGRRGYRHYLDRFRDGLRECCGMSKPQAAEYGLQSMRSGGDTWLYEKGASQAVRMAVGDWKTPGVEAGYLRIAVQQKLAAMKASGV